MIGQKMLDFGLSGWMADFGEYLPTDVRLANGMDGMLMHNAWPALWAEVNAKGVAGRGKTGEALFFMRAGYSGRAALIARCCGQATSRSISAGTTASAR
jgi:alpha-glucosidase